MIAADAEREEKAKALEREIFTSIANTVLSTRARYQAVKDPMMRNYLLLDKFLLLTDGLSGYLDHKLEGIEDKRLQKKVSQAVASVKEDLLSLQEWVLHPTYAPDHPYGKSVMDAAEGDFGDLAPKVESKR